MVFSMTPGNYADTHYFSTRLTYSLALSVGRERTPMIPASLYGIEDNAGYIGDTPPFGAKMTYQSSCGSAPP